MYVSLVAACILRARGVDACSRVSLHSPDSVPTLMTRVPTIESRVIVGPNKAMPRAILSFSSFWLVELSANWASTDAFERSRTSTKKKSASLKTDEDRQRRVDGRGTACWVEFIIRTSRWKRQRRKT